MMMKRHLVALVLLFTCLQSVLCTDVQPYSSSPSGALTGELRKWHKITLGFEGPQTSETDPVNPFTDYRLDITFTHPATGTSHVVPGYYAADGNAANSRATEGNVWLVHFAPDQVGSWTWTASFTEGPSVAQNGGGSSAGFFDNETGSFSVKSTNKTGRDHRGKGLLQYVGEHHMQFAETKEWFLKAGADSPENFLAYDDFDNTPNYKDFRKSWAPHEKDYNNGDPTWAGGLGKGIIGAINYLSEKGMNAFSFLPMNIEGDDRNVFPYISDFPGDDRLRIDVSKTAQWEVVFEHADKMGMNLHFKTQETENDQLLDGGALGNERKFYYRELIARFGHHLALTWNLGEENTNTLEERESFADFFKQTDPYQHLVVIHNNFNDHQGIYNPLLGYPSFDGVSLQSKPVDIFDHTLEWTTKSADAGRKWVVANDEQSSAKVGVRPDSDDAAHDDIRKDVLWGNFMAHGAGVEYYFGYSFDNSDLTCEDFRSRDAMWDQSRYALEFFSKFDVPFWEMKSDNDRLSNGWCLANNDVLVVYLKNGGSTSIDLAGDSSKQYTVEWYDPRNGGDLQNGSVSSVSGGKNRNLGVSPGSGAGQDWVALVRSEPAPEEAALSPTDPPVKPTLAPTGSPTRSPTSEPTVAPTSSPTDSPSWSPTESPSDEPSATPETPEPTSKPTDNPTDPPTVSPSLDPTASPSDRPSETPETPAPTSKPTESPTVPPTSVPTFRPTQSPSDRPSETPETPEATSKPTESPTVPPTSVPTFRPTQPPSKMPSESPETPEPTSKPTAAPTIAPTDPPTSNPTSVSASSATPEPTSSPTELPTKAPTDSPTDPPTKAPTDSPTDPPTSSPTSSPVIAASDTLEPVSTATASPTDLPTWSPTESPSEQPSEETEEPTVAPVDPTSAPVDTTPSPLHPTPAPVDPTPAPIGPTPAPVPFTPIYINAGGETFVDVDGVVWQEDAFYNYGAKGKTSEDQVIVDAHDSRLYRTDRWDNSPHLRLTYDIPVPEGEYEVSLYFSENYNKAQFVDGRVFDVWMEEKVAFADVDIFEQSGGPFTALIKTTTVYVSDGSLTIVFYREIQNPKVAGIEIHSTSSSMPSVSPSPTYGPTFEPTVSPTESPTDSPTAAPTDIPSALPPNATSQPTELLDGVALESDEPKDGVVGFTLVSASTFEDFYELMNGDTIDLAVVGDELSVRADVAGSKVESVVFDMDGILNLRTEGKAPYSLNGDFGTEYRAEPRLLELGEHTLSATAFSRNGGGGEQLGETLTVVFNVVSETTTTTLTPTQNFKLATPTEGVVGFTLIDSNADDEIRVLTDGDTIDLTLEGYFLTIRADTVGPVMSVVFDFDDISAIKTENWEPWSLTGDEGGDHYASERLRELGQHTVSATAFSKQDGEGEPIGTKLTIGLTVVATYDESKD